MSITRCVCIGCGSSLDKIFTTNEGLTFIYCEYCGNKYLIDTPITNYFIKNYYISNIQADFKSKYAQPYTDDILKKDNSSKKATIIVIVSIISACVLSGGISECINNKKDKDIEYLSENSIIHKELERKETKPVIHQKIKVNRTKHHQHHTSIVTELPPNPTDPDGNTGTPP